MPQVVIVAEYLRIARETGIAYEEVNKVLDVLSEATKTGVYDHDVLLRAANSLGASEERLRLAVKLIAERCK